MNPQTMLAKTYPLLIWIVAFLFGLSLRLGPGPTDKGRPSRVISRETDSVVSDFVVVMRLYKWKSQFLEMLSVLKYRTPGPSDALWKSGSNGGSESTTETAHPG